MSDVLLALPHPLAEPSGSSLPAPTRHSIRLRLAPIPQMGEPPVWDVERRRDGEDVPWLSVARRGDAYLLRAHGYADFWVRGNIEEVLCAVEEGVAPAALEHLLLDGILPQLLHLVGFTSFHASAIADSTGRVAALMGVSGSGKSTLAGSFAEAGASASEPGHGAVALVGDDTLSLLVEDARVKVYASYPRVRLWADSAGALFDKTGGDRTGGDRTGGDRTGGDRTGGDRTGGDRTGRDEEVKSHIEVRSSGASELELAAVFAIVRDAPEPFVEPLGRRDAVVEIAKHLDRLLPQDRDQLRREFDTLEALTKIVPVARLGVPHDYARLGEVRALVSDHAFRGSTAPGCSL